MEIADFAVLESRWHDDRNLSVRPVFDLISHSCFMGLLDAIPYERFISQAAFEDAFLYLTSKPKVETLYIGCHGDSGSLFAADKSEIDRGRLKSIVHQKRLSGLFFGCCSFASEENARFLMEGDSFLTWVAGYECGVDWGKSTLLDGAFWMEYVQNDAQERFATHWRTNKIKEVCAAVKQSYGGLVEKLKFNVFWRHDIGRKEIINLMSES